MATICTTRAQRIMGYDFARGICVFGMFLMNFKIVMHNPAEKIEGFWPLLLTSFEGRFAVLFIILAGIGVSLLTKRARTLPDSALLSKNRRILIIRAAFLFAIGLLYLPLWEADILHYYGVYIFIGVFILTWSDRWLIALSFLVMLLFLFLFTFTDWETGWNFQTLTYEGLWTFDGFFRNTFFNGFHPVFPWFAFFIFGLLMGRQNLTDKKLRKKYLTIATLGFIFCETVSFCIVKAVADPEAKFLFSTLSFPPFPLFMISGICSSMIIIILSIVITEKVPHVFTRPFISTGQMVLTHYVSHVVIGMVILDIMGKLYNQPLSFAVFFSFVFFILSVMFSVAWNQYFAKGPLETVLRKISG